MITTRPEIVPKKDLYRDSKLARLIKDSRKVVLPNEVINLLTERD